jgi:hypothetical protein
VEDVVISVVSAVVIACTALMAVWWQQGRADMPILPHIYQPWTFESEYAPGIPVCPLTDAMGVCQPRQI